ncbi:MAG: sigma-70 family RNA polymerase sigma factor [Bacteroidota bacterium]
MKKYSDSDIISMLQSGDRALQDAAFRHLYHCYFGLIESLIVRNSGQAHEVKDVFHDGLIVLFNKVKTADFSLSSTLKTYLYAICRNLWLLKLKKQKREVVLEDTHERMQVEESHFQTLVETERKALVRSMIESLGRECQQILELYYYRRLKMVQIQQTLGLVSEQVVKNKKGKCLRKLRENVAPAYRRLLKENG